MMMTAITAYRNICNNLYSQSLSPSFLVFFSCIILSYKLSLDFNLRGMTIPDWFEVEGSASAVRVEEGGEGLGTGRIHRRGTHRARSTKFIPTQIIMLQK